MNISTPIPSLSAYNLSYSFRPIEFFRPLQVRDSHLRTLAIASIVDKLYRIEKEDNVKVILHFIPTAVRIVNECPFEDVRTALSAYLDHLTKDYDIVIPSLPSPSMYIPVHELIPKYTLNEQYRRLFEWSFITYGRVSNITTVLAYHPTYLECFLQTYSVLLYDEGPLPVPWRAYLSILASARHGCTYYIRRQQDTFLSHGGDPAWLLGLNHPNVPPKIAAIAELNALLAHRPWMITPAHIKALTSGNSGWSWSVNELVHAIVILAAFHSSCSLILACGICRESDNGILLGLQPFRAIEKHSSSTTLPIDTATNYSSTKDTVTDTHSVSSTLSSSPNLRISAANEPNGGSSSSSTVASVNTPVPFTIRPDAGKEAELRFRLLQTSNNHQGNIDYDRYSEIGIDENAITILEDTKSVRTTTSYHSGGKNSDSKKNSNHNNTDGGSNPGVQPNRSKGVGGGEESTPFHRTATTQSSSSSSSSSQPNIGGWDLTTGNDEEVDEEDEEEGNGEDEDYDEYDDEDDDDLESELDFERAGLGGALLSGYNTPLTTDNHLLLNETDPSLAFFLRMNNNGNNREGNSSFDLSIPQNIFSPVIENGLDGANYRGKGIIQFVQESEKILALQKAYMTAYISGVPLTPRASTGPAGLVLSQRERRRTFRNAQRDKQRLSATGTGGSNDIVPTSTKFSHPTTTTNHTNTSTSLAVVKEEEEENTGNGKKEGEESIERHSTVETNVAAGSTTEKGDPALVKDNVNDVPVTLPESSSIPASSTASSSSSSPSPYTLHIENLRYRDFDTSENGLITHDFNWEEHGYALIARFHPSAAPALDRQFTTAYQLTYGKLGASGEEVNTEKLRTAIWYYIQRLFGVRNDHYDYALVNRFMTISTKTFAKKVACAPETITANDFSSFSTMFTSDEKVHIALLAAEARRQAALLWGLSAVMKHMTGANK